LTLTFKRDLDKGLTIEEEVLSLIKNRYPSATQIDGYCPSYDIWIPEISKSVEVKSDEKSLETGNFVIEIEMFGKPSGLLKSKADYWVIFDGINFLWTTPTKIFECILLNKINYVSFIGNGDSQRKKAILIKKELLGDYLLRGIK
tara:strand:+ start:654 stop:1088 length:435 start_codon:yes stop_codon:yes gene_type:complete